MREQVLAACKRIVVKVGSSLVASSQGGLRLDRINRLAQELGALQAQDRQIVVVSSGGGAACGEGRGWRGRRGTGDSAGGGRNDA